jgi:magnesium-transporting ATPase (P-type)
MRDFWRENVFTIFNLSLVGIVIAQLLLGQPLGALISLGVIALNIGLKLRRELRIQKKLEEFVQAARAKSTVIREGKTQSIDPGAIVLGDMLVAGPGDQLFVDGEIVGEGWVLVDEALLTGKSARITKRGGDPIYAGSLCVSGRAVYKAQKVGEERLIVTRISDSPVRKVALTPLERTVENVLKVLLVVVVAFMIFLARIYFRLDAVIVVDEQAFVDAASIIFNIAPGSLYFMIIFAYAAGTTDLAKLGALVRQARSVESLAQVSVVCFAQAGILTGTHVEVETIKSPAGREQLAKSRIRQIVGDYATNTSVSNLATQVMTDTFEGTRRAVHEEAPFLSVYGWSAIAFDDADLRGTYVLGEPQVLETYLATDNELAEEEVESEPTVWHRAIAPLGRFFRRSESETEEANAEQAPEPEPETKPETEESQLPEAVPLAKDESPRLSISQRLTGPVVGMLQRGEAPSDEPEFPRDESRPNPFRRLTRRVGGLLQREKTAPEQAGPNKAAAEETALMFAYSPGLAPLHSVEGLPQLPEGLIPLCKLRYTEQVRPVVIDTIRTFSETGVDFKVFTARSPDRTIAILKQAGLGADSETPLGVLTGPELAEMDAQQLAQAASENTVFGQVTPEQAGLVVEALREQGESVAVVGDRVSALPAMRQASLAIARQSSSQAAISAADIILLKDSPRVLQAVVHKGQRIANGLLDVLKLNLTQVFYLALLIAGIRLAGTGFPLQPTQLTVINLVTFAVPSAALSLWAAAGVLPSANLGLLLARFVAPAAITMGAAAMVVYQIFLDRTGEVAYAQIALTYTLVLSGLVLVIFIRPPWRPPLGSDVQGGDWRPTILVVALIAVFLLVAQIPFAQEYLLLEPLWHPADYVVVGIAVLAWASLLSFVRLAGTLGGRLWPFRIRPIA